MTVDLADRTAAAIAADVSARKVMARDVVRACLARVEATNATLNAVCTLNPPRSPMRTRATGASRRASRRGSSRACRSW